MIREKDGIHVDNGKFVMDARSATGEVNFTSHAHMDHVHQNSGKIVSSELTAKLASERLDKKLEASQHPDIELLDSGHILGSSSALIERGDEKILYTGDVSTQDRAYLDGFEAVDADVLIIESTYGIPAYRLPDQGEVEDEIKAWLKDTDAPFLFGYSLGKAQKIQYLVQEATDRPIIAHGAVKKMNDVVEKHTDLEFNALEYGKNKDLLRSGEGIFIGPTNFSRKDALNKLVEQASGKKAGFSGWGVQDSYKYKGGYDTVFPYTDHCGFDDLVELVKNVDPRKIYTHHGFDEAFAKHLSNKMGYNARALKNNQASLTDF